MRLQTVHLADAQNDEIKLVNATYRLWKETYGPILKDAGLALQPESFHRSQFLTVIHDQGAPLSFSLSSFLNLTIDGTADMKYFDPMSACLKEKFTKENPRVMTIEWVTVHPKERERVSKIRQSDLIMGCSFRAFRDSAADVAMGFSRTDLGADRIAEQFGCVGQETTSLFGIECRVMMISKQMLKPHRFAVVQREIDSLCDARPLQLVA